MRRVPESTPQRLSLITVYRLTLQAVLSEPKVWAPFVILLVLELTGLVLIYIAPREPFIRLLGPPIAVFYGSQFLHYPDHFRLFVRAGYHLRVVISLLFGPLMLGAITVLLGQVYRRKTLVLLSALKQALGRYIQLFFIIIVVYAAIHILTLQVRDQIIAYFASGHTALLGRDIRWWLVPFMALSNFIIMIVIHGLFIYSIPMILLDNVPLTKAIIRSMRLFVRYFSKSCIIIGVPMFFYVPIIILQSYSAAIIANFQPEAVMGVFVVAAVLNWLIIDVLITVATTFLYLESKHCR